MPEEYKLIYFHGRGRGEMIRYILAHANVPYEEHTIKSDEWMDEKSKMPFGSVPVLEVNGKKLAQSTTIARFLAEKHDLAGKDAWTRANADMIIQAIEDIYGNYRNFVLAIFSNDGERKAKTWKILRNDSLKPLYERLEAILGTGRYISGDQLTYADLALAELSDRIEKCFEKDFMDAYPTLKTHMNRIHELPNIKEYVRKRPAYQM